MSAADYQSVLCKQKSLILEKLVFPYIILGTQESVEFKNGKITNLLRNKSIQFFGIMALS
jgi:hypothetical protein